MTGTFYTLGDCLSDLGRVITRDWAHGIGHSLVCQTLLQIL